MPILNIYSASDAALLAACTTWLVTHRVLMNRGFTLRWRGRSTDVRVSALIGLMASCWAASVFMDEVWPYWQQDGLSLETIAGMATAPLLVQTLFSFWLVSSLDGRANANGPAGPSRFWNLSELRGPFDWASGVTTSFYVSLCVVVIIVVGTPSIAAVLTGSVLQGVLNIIGCAVFFMAGTANNPYVLAPHHYVYDMLRVVLPTSHHEGTVYILPSPGKGFDAVWSPKIKNEYLEADSQAMVLFQHMRSGIWSPKEPLERMRTLLSLYHQRLILSSEDVAHLARWLYVDESADHSMRRIKCERAPNVHLIGRDLIFALCHAEYIVFMGQGRLPRGLQAKLGMLRLMTRSGASSSSDEPVHTIGFLPGLDGYREAVRHVYAIFDEPLEDDSPALNFDPDLNPPKYSSALSKAPSDINTYTTELWNLSTKHSESTCTALYMFLTVWFIEMGNVNGFHIFPLRCRNRNGDLVSQQIVWRQAWYSGIIAQLISVSPVFYAAFVVGYLQ